MKELYAGIDLGARVCVWEAVNGRGKSVEKGSFSPSETNLMEFAKRLGPRATILMEEGEMAGWAYRTLLPYAMRVIVCDPKHNAWIYKTSRKSDSIDAGKLAEICRLGTFKEVYNPKEEAMAAFKKATQQQQTLTRGVAALKSRIKGQFRREGEVVCGSRVFGEEKGKEMVGRVKNQVVRQLIQQNFRLMRETEKEKDKALKLVEGLARRFPVMEAYQEVPGLGPIMAARFVAEIQTPHRFRNKRKVWQTSRLGIRDRSSDGSPIGFKRLDRQAGGALKEVSRTVFERAMCCKYDNLFKRTYRRSLERTKNPVHARLNTERKIIAVMWAMWRDGTRFKDDIDENRA